MKTKTPGDAIVRDAVARDPSMRDAVARDPSMRAATPRDTSTRAAASRDNGADAAVPPRKMELFLPTRTIFKVLVAVLLAWLAAKVWPEVVFLSVSLLVAVALEPAVKRLERRGLPRSAIVSTLAIVLLGLLVAVALLVVPPVVEQSIQLLHDFPSFKERLLARIPPHEQVLRETVEQVFALPSGSRASDMLSQGMSWGKVVVSVVMSSVYVVIVTLYLLLDGKRVYAWLLAYVPRARRERVAETVHGVSEVVTAYVQGQALTSALCGVFTAVLLHACKVPAALPLAVFAAVCDVVPVIGVVISLVPTALLALTVSPATALIVVAAYLLYHQLESYVIVPRIYGSSLRISTLAVLLALIVGGTIQGILGAVLVLPLVAAYPIIERIWLRDVLAPEVLRDHEALAEAVETGNEQAIDAVLSGQEHPCPLPEAPAPQPTR